MNKTISGFLVAFGIIVSLGLTVPEAQGRDIVAVGKNATLPAGETAHDVVVVLGSASIDGTVEGDLVVVSGDLTLNGTAEHDVVVVGGKVILGPTAKIKNEAILVGSSLTRDPQATIEGNVAEILPNLHLPQLRGLLDWVSQGLMAGRLLPPGVPWVRAAIAVFLVIFLLIALLFKRPLLAGVETIEARPIASFFAGFLVFLLMVPVMILLAVSVVGIVLIPFLVSALVFAFLLGHVVIYQTVGFRFSEKLRAPGWPSVIAMLLGAAIFVVLYMVPILGFLMWKLVTILGIGAVTVAAFQSFRREKTSKTPTITFPAPNAATVATPAGLSAVAPVTTAPLAATAPSATPDVNPPPAPSIAPMPTAFAEPPRLNAVRTAASQTTGSFAPAGFWIRFCSMVLDFVLVGGLLAIVQLWPVFPLAWIAYHLGFWIWKGTTIGDIILGIKCVRTDGRPLNFAVAVVRGFSSFFSALAFGLGFFWAGWDQHKQAWHDKIAGTFMVKVPKGVSLV